jgi:hypothetical protein
MVPGAVREGRAATLNLPHALATTLFVQSQAEVRISKPWRRSRS